MWAYRVTPDENLLSIDLLSIETSANPVARVVSERVDSKDTQPLNYNWYAVVQSSDGVFYQSGPRSNIDFGHHRSEPVSDASLGIKP